MGLLDAEGLCELAVDLGPALALSHRSINRTGPV